MVGDNEENKPIALLTSPSLPQLLQLGALEFVPRNDMTDNSDLRVN